MSVDAQYFGNISRFVNHASNKVQTDEKEILSANLETRHYSIYGIEMILFIASRDIVPGEQLLIDYGKKYFRPGEEVLFLKNGRFKENKKDPSYNRRKGAYDYSVMVRLSLVKTEAYLFLRISIAVILLVFIVLIMGYFNI